MKMNEKYPFNEADFEKIDRQDLPLKLHEAIRFAQEKYFLQPENKQTDIVHPLEVLQILMGENCTIQTAIAAVLHDVLEATECTAEEVEEKFGNHVCFLVETNNDIKFEKALEGMDESGLRKIVKQFRGADFDVRQLALANTVSNLRAMVYDYSLLGEKMWERIPAGKENIREYCLHVIDALEEMSGHRNTRAEYWEMNSLFKHLFVDFYIQKAGWMRTIYQDMGKEMYALEMDSLIWKPVWEIPEDVEWMSKQKAESLEDLWRRKRN